MVMAKAEKEVRCATGIAGFDKICSGGFINDSLNLVTGNAGAGKTTFLLQFLYNGATKFNENGLYVSFEPEPEDIYRAGKKQGMDIEDLEKQGKCLVVKIDTGMTIKEIQKRLSMLIIKNDIKRICFDPINVFSIGLPKEISSRKQIYDFLSLLKQLGVCVLISGETDGLVSENDELSEDIKFSSGLSAEGDRALRITKMRMTNHFRGPIGFKITDKGLEVSSK
jgi:circadian clock protein KaiC